MNIVILDAGTVSHNDLDLNVFSKFGDVTIYDNCHEKNDVIKAIENADIVLLNKVQLRREVLSHAKNLKFITLFATGYNNIDIEYCNENNIVVSNAGSYSTNAVAQHTFAMILEFYNRVGDYNRDVHNGEWIKSSIFTAFRYPTDELAGKTLGIFGLGSIGKAVADIALAFNMNVIATSRTPKNYKTVKDVDFTELLADSDILTIHCPLTDVTKGLFTKNEFASMKKGSYLINTSRGPVICEEDLVNALKIGHLAGAAVDVIEKEPMKEGCILMEAPNIIITPHVGWTPITTRKRLVDILMKNIEGFLNNKPQNVVTKH